MLDKWYSANMLKRLKRNQLVAVASSLGLPVAGRADAALIREILIRQSDVAARAANEDSDVRLAILEDGVAKLDVAIAELAAVVHELAKVSVKLSSIHGVVRNDAKIALAADTLRIKTILSGCYR